MNLQNLERHLAEQVKIVDVTGRFDARTAPAVQEKLTSALAQGITYLVINLQAVDFIDSTALSTLVQALKHARQRDGDIRLFGLRQPVRIIFELTRLDKVFDIYASEEEAVQSLLGRN
jgi:anti-sigma B factor antagonist